MRLSQKKYQQALGHAGKISNRIRFYRRSTVLVSTALIFSAGFYFIAAGVLNPRFLLADAKAKAGTVLGVTTVSVRVIGPPEKPVVTATPGCTGLAPHVSLSWQETLDTDTYDILRDSLPLVGGLITESYQDDAVVLNTAYTYEVTAVGPRGSTTSDPVNATTAASCLIPACTITSVGGIDMTQESGTPRLSKKKPTIAGTTNMPNADIEISLTNNPSIVATLSANINGYWSWTPTINLDNGLHTVTVTATDPGNPLLTITVQRTFKIVSEEEEEEEKKDKQKTPFAEPLQPIQPAVTPEIPEEPGLEMRSEIVNADGIVFTGDDLVVRTTITPDHPQDFQGGQRATILYQIIDAKQNILVEDQDDIFINPENELIKNIAIPKLMPEGAYTLRVGLSLNDSVYVSEVNFTLKEKPILTIGKTYITWSWIMERLGWFLLWLLILLILFLILLALEHHKSTKALIHITEEMLAGRGQIPRRKGVAR